jgi:adenylylsulfate kinase
MLTKKHISMKSSTLSVQAEHRLSMGISGELDSDDFHRANSPQTLPSVSPRSPMPVLWLTGLPAAGKSTIARLTARRLADDGIPSEVLDGDEFRKAISPTLGFSREERAIQVMRLAWVAEMLSRHGVITIVAAVSPYRDDRKSAAALLGSRFAEIWVHADAAVCRTRDPKGLWRRCELGEISGVTGFDAPYEEPLSAALKLETEFCPASRCATELVNFVVAKCANALHSSLI